MGNGIAACSHERIVAFTRWWSIFALFVQVQSLEPVVYLTSARGCEQVHAHTSLFPDTLICNVHVFPPAVSGFCFPERKKKKLNITQ